MISCKQCGAESPNVIVAWREDWVEYYQRECSVSIELPDRNQTIYENGDEVALDRSQFFEYFVQEDGYEDDRDSTESEMNDWTIRWYQCGSCGRQGKLDEMFTPGDELDALLNQLGKTLKARR